MDEFVETVARIAPTFGGINLEDIKSPECFEIEERLKKRLQIPVFHDDQHGTAIISAAALLNALEVVGKKIEDVKVVFFGAGASAIACARLYLSYGVRRENLRMVDKSGVIYHGRTKDMNPYKAEFAVETSERTLQDALDGRRRVRRPLLGRHRQGRDARGDGARPDRLRAGQPGPGDHARGGEGGAARRRSWRPAAATIPTRSTTSSGSRSSSAARSTCGRPRSTRR